MINLTIRIIRGYKYDIAPRDRTLLLQKPTHSMRLPSKDEPKMAFAFCDVARRSRLSREGANHLLEQPSYQKLLVRQYSFTAIPADACQDKEMQQRQERLAQDPGSSREWQSGAGRKSLPIRKRKRGLWQLRRMHSTENKNEAVPLLGLCRLQATFFDGRVSSR